MPTVKVNDINMYYEIHGEGEPLVLINGAGISHESFLALLPRYSEHFKCIVFDNRGVGKTDAPDITYTTEMMARDLAGLLNIIGVSKTHVSGASMGGMIAQQFAINYPEKVNRLILKSTWCGGPKSIPYTGPEMDPTDPKAVELLFAEQFVAEHPDMFRNAKDMLPAEWYTPTGLLRHLQAAESHDAYENLPRITAPTLIITGDSDRMVNPENSKILADRIPNSELVIFPNTGHALFEAGDEPDILSIKFLKGEKVAT
jgi:pimeloyl-ACP methyl ester carboxylesterase